MTSPKLIKNDNLEEEHQEVQGKFEQSERSELYLFIVFLVIRLTLFKKNETFLNDFQTLCAIFQKSILSPTNFHGQCKM